MFLREPVEITEEEYNAISATAKLVFDKLKEVGDARIVKTKPKGGYDDRKVSW